MSSLFELETPLWELIIRGSVLYWGILLLMRILPRRTGGELAVMDLIFILLVSEAAAHALGDYSSLTEGFIVIATLMGWNFAINVLSYYFPLFEKLVSAPPLPVVKDGKLLRRNMRREYLTEEELMEHLRKEGIDDINDVKTAHVEGEGHISIVKRNKQG